MTEQNEGTISECSFGLVPFNSYKQLIFRLTLNLFMPSYQANEFKHLVMSTLHVFQNSNVNGNLKRRLIGINLNWNCLLKLIEVKKKTWTPIRKKNWKTRQKITGKQNSQTKHRRKQIVNNKNASSIAFQVQICIFIFIYAFLHGVTILSLFNNNESRFKCL